MRLGEKIGQPQKTEERENPDDGLRSTCHQDFLWNNKKVYSAL